MTDAAVEVRAQGQKWGRGKNSQSIAGGGGFRMKPFTTRGPIWTTAWMITSMAAMVAILCLLGATQTYARKMATRDDHRAGFSGVVRADIHNTIAAYYRKDAKRLDAGAENFAALAEVHRESRGAYRYGPFATGLEPGVCTILAEHRAKMAAKARDLAGNHEELAQLLSDQSPSVSSHRKAAPERLAPPVSLGIPTD